MPDVTKGAANTTAVVDAIAPPQATPAPDPGRKEKPASLWSNAWGDLRRNPYFIVSAVLILVLLIIAAFPGVFAGADPRSGDLRNHYLGEPQLSHWFSEEWLGYDGQGRSIYTRLVFGARASILVGGGVTLLSTIVGGFVGMLAGYFGGWLDSLLSRITDVFFAIPFLLGALIVLNSFETRSVFVVILAMSFLAWPQVARIMRGAVITNKQADYVHAARALGASTFRILSRHILPNAIAPVIVVATISLGIYISTEATLSFLGIGLADPTVSWGMDISSASKVIRNAPHVLFFPAAMLSVTVLAFIMLGDAVRDALDPKLR